MPKENNISSKKCLPFQRKYVAPCHKSGWSEASIDMRKISRLQAKTRSALRGKKCINERERGYICKRCIKIANGTSESDPEDDNDLHALIMKDIKSLKSRFTLTF